MRALRRRYTDKWPSYRSTPAIREPYILRGYLVVAVKQCHRNEKSTRKNAVTEKKLR
jgi:hypothetical protein